MSFLGTPEDAKRAQNAVCTFDDAMEAGSPIMNGQSDGGGQPGEVKSAEFKPKTYEIHESQKSVRRSYK